MEKVKNKRKKIFRMININKILVPTDFSKCAYHALKYGISLAEKYNSELHLLHADTLFVDNPEILNNISELYDTHHNVEEDLRKQINQVIDGKELKNLKIVQSRKRGIAAAPTILEYSDNNNIDLIVIGTNGRRGLGHLFLGSVAEEVVRLSYCPVITIKGEDQNIIQTFKSILVPIDFSERSNDSIEYAKEIAKLNNSTLHLLHIIQDDLPAAYSLVGMQSIYDLLPNIEEKINTRMENLYHEITGFQKEYEHVIVNGHPVAEIIKYAESSDIDLIVIATHGLTGLKHLFLGSVTEKVVRMSQCPVFITKPFGKKIIKRR